MLVDVLGCVVLCFQTMTTCCSLISGALLFCSSFKSRSPLEKSSPKDRLVPPVKHLASSEEPFSRSGASVGMSRAQTSRFLASSVIILDLRESTCHHMSSVPLKPLFFAVDKVSKARCVQLRHLSPGVLWTDPLWTTQVN